jgi:hypothetical protein
LALTIFAKGAAYPTVAGDLTPEKLHAHVSEQLSNENAAGIMEAYGVTPNMDQNHFVTSAMRWCGDVIFDGMLSFVEIAQL